LSDNTMRDPKLTAGQTIYLDFLRAAAAAMVLVGHAAAWFLGVGNWISRAGLQGTGVAIFFLISGFLIARSVVTHWNDSSYGWRAYFLDRLCRIYCPLIPALIVGWMLDSLVIATSAGSAFPADPELATLLASLPERTGLSQLVGNVSMLQDFPAFQLARRLGVGEALPFIRPFGSNAPLWTISIEWWIYIAFGLATLRRLRGKKPLRWWEWLVLSLAAVEPIYHSAAGPDNCLGLLWLVGLGALYLFARLNFDIASSTATRCAAILLVASVPLYITRAAAILVHEGSLKVVEFQLSIFMAIALFSGLWLCGTWTTAPRWLGTAVSFAAAYSYSLYLTHHVLLVFLYAMVHPTGTDVQLFFVSIVIANLIAIPFSWLFERPHRRLAIFLKQRLGS
jgi:peptidoglycan/LPS O-acetylase OafA/YrhL